MALIAVSPWLAKKFGKAEVGIVATLSTVVLFVVAYFPKIEDSAI
ncbi:hypothetical protein [Corynebacterium deserti]|nr:hypothetical protein [Corynebacterium deserti]